MASKQTTTKEKRTCRTRVGERVIERPIRHDLLLSLCRKRLKKSEKQNSRRNVGPSLSFLRPLISKFDLVAVECFKINNNNTKNATRISGARILHRCRPLNSSAFLISASAMEGESMEGPLLLRSFSYPFRSLHSTYIGSGSRLSLRKNSSMRHELKVIARSGWILPCWTFNAI